jgi:hypothetical protein
LQLEGCSVLFKFDCGFCFFTGVGFCLFLSFLTEVHLSAKVTRGEKCDYSLSTTSGQLKIRNQSSVYLHFGFFGQNSLFCSVLIMNPLSVHICWRKDSLCQCFFMPSQTQNTMHLASSSQSFHLSPSRSQCQYMLLYTICYIYFICIYLLSQGSLLSKLKNTYSMFIGYFIF